MTTPTDGGGGSQRDENTDIKPARKIAGEMSAWHPWVTIHGSAKRRLHEETAAAAVLKNKHIVQEQEGKKEESSV